MKRSSRASASRRKTNSAPLAAPDKSSNPQPHADSKPVNAQPRKRQKTMPTDFEAGDDSDTQLPEQAFPLSELPLDVLFGVRISTLCRIDHSTYSTRAP